MAKAMFMNHPDTSYSVEERRRISKLAATKVGSGMSLIFGAGGAILFVLLFVTAPLVTIPISEMTGLSLSAVALALAFGASTCCAIIYAKVMAPKIRYAQEIDAELQYRYQAKRRAEVESRLAASTSGQTVSREKTDVGEPLH